MPQPVDGPATAELVTAQLSQTDDRNAAHIERGVAAANTYVRRLRCADIDAAEWPDDIVLGAVMLAARLVRRRNQPDGVAALTDAGAVYIARNDPDIAMLLQVGAYGAPSVG